MNGLRLKGFPSIPRHPERLQSSHWNHWRLRSLENVWNYRKYRSVELVLIDLNCSKIRRCGVRTLAIALSSARRVCLAQVAKIGGARWSESRHVSTMFEHIDCEIPDLCCGFLNAHCLVIVTCWHNHYEVDHYHIATLGMGFWVLICLYLLQEVRVLASRAGMLEFKCRLLPLQKT